MKFYLYDLAQSQNMTLYSGDERSEVEEFEIACNPRIKLSELQDKGIEYLLPDLCNKAMEQMGMLLTAHAEEAQDNNPDKPYMYVLVRTQPACLPADEPPVPLYELNGEPYLQDWDSETHEPEPLPEGAVQVGMREGALGWLFFMNLGLLCSDNPPNPEDSNFQEFDELPWWTKPMPTGVTDKRTTTILRAYLQTPQGRCRLASMMGKQMGIGAAPK